MKKWLSILLLALSSVIVTFLTANLNLWDDNFEVIGGSHKVFLIGFPFRYLHMGGESSVNKCWMVMSHIGNGIFFFVLGYIMLRWFGSRKPAPSQGE